MIKVNLLPIKELMRKQMLIQHAIIGAIPIILAAIIIVMFNFSVSARIKRLDAEIKVSRNEITKLDRVIGRIDKLKKDKKELEERLIVIDKLNKNRSIPVHILDELSKNIPEKLWINSLSQSGSKLTLKGVGLDNETIVNFIKNLKKSKYLDSVELTVTQHFVQEGFKLKKFEIICQTRVPS
jgi:type IV pilus assembly protein PilN